ncbi:MAG TPA: hypothetical protein DEB71_20240, partial [Chryseobacterium carnipullorum]|nr:hypothetical protein [Chryseobacterium carnipullorum]
GLKSQHRTSSIHKEENIIFEDLNTEVLLTIYVMHSETLLIKEISVTKNREWLIFQRRIKRLLN